MISFQNVRRIIRAIRLNELEMERPEQLLHLTQLWHMAGVVFVMALAKELSRP